MRALLARLGDPHRRLRIVHVAGSKGKGSTAAMLAAVLRRAGYRTGLFTSPHLCRFEERFQVDGRPITPDELAALLSDVRDGRRAPAAGRRTPTFFEVATAVGFLHFVRRRADAAVLEVGLGGRLDSTNVCLPALAVITSISYDHTQHPRRPAGQHRPREGRHRQAGPAGRLRRHGPGGARRHRGRLPAAPRPAAQLDVDFRFAYRPGRVARGRQSTGRAVAVTTRRRPWPALELGLLGEHQAANAAVVVACVEQLRQARLAPAATRRCARVCAR